MFLHAFYQQVYFSLKNACGHAGDEKLTFVTKKAPAATLTTEKIVFHQESACGHAEDEKSNCSPKKKPAAMLRTEKFLTNRRRLRPR